MKTYSVVVKPKISLFGENTRALVVRSVGGQAPERDINIIAFKYDDVTRSD